MAKLKTIEWVNNKVRIVEQTKLPTELVYIDIDTIEEMYDAIKILKVRGAPAIGIAAAGFEFGAYYCYSDEPARSSNILTPNTASEIDAKWADKTGTEYAIKFVDASGQTEAAGDYGAKIGFTLGTKMQFAQDEDVEQPFVGIGLEIGNRNNPYDADAAGMNALYFDYKATAGEYLKVSIKTTQTFQEEGAEFYVRVPASDSWKGALIPFENIDLPWWDDLDSAEKFLSSEILEITWVVEGDENATGELAIDNVYFVDQARVGIQLFDNSMFKIKKGISFKQVSNRLVYSLPEGVSKAEVSLFNLSGQKIVSHIPQNRQLTYHTLPINAMSLPAGTYILRVKDRGIRKGMYCKALSLMK
jgi:hypothetical protein